MTSAIQYNPQKLWGDFLATVQAKLSNHVYETWLKPVRCSGMADDTVVLEVRDQFFRDFYGAPVCYRGGGGAAAASVG